LFLVCGGFAADILKFMPYFHGFDFLTPILPDLGMYASPTSSYDSVVENQWSCPDCRSIQTKQPGQGNLAEQPFLLEISLCKFKNTFAQKL